MARNTFVLLLKLLESEESLYLKSMVNLLLMYS